MNRKTLILGGALLIIAATFFVLSKIITPKQNDNQLAPITNGEQKTEDENTVAETAFPLSPATISNLSIQAKAEFDFALNKAKEWRGDSTPMAVVIKYTDEINPGKGKNTYVFLSPSLSQYYFTVNIEQEKNEYGTNNFERILYYREDYFLPKDVTVLPIKYWAIDYLSALQKADMAVGKEIRKDNKEYDVNMFLFSREGGLLSWNIEYLVSETKKASVTIDAYTGEIAAR